MERACIYCEKEQGTFDPSSGKTHGYCLRHVAADLEGQYSPRQIEAYKKEMAALAAKGEVSLCPDLSESKRKIVRELCSLDRDQS